METKTYDVVNDVEVMDETNAERFCFDGRMEFILYAKHCKDKGKKNNVIWVNSNEYLSRFMQGYRLFEDMKYAKALRAYKNAMVVNPVAIMARFEICECYIAMLNFLGARSTLMEMTEYLVEAQHIARFYRRMGFIATETGDYKLAIACYLFSRSFEKSDVATAELLYLRKVAKDIREIGDPEAILRKAGVPILTGYVLTDRKIG